LSAKPRVLVIDDEALIGMWLQAELERLGCEVVGIASTRAECLEAVERERPDAIFMDICLPNGEDGIEIAREVKALSGAALVFVTGYSNGDYRERAMALEPLAYVAKPVSGTALCKLVALLKGDA
jgi:CheY-like chemotaxis protein